MVPGQASEGQDVPERGDEDEARGRRGEALSGGAGEEWDPQLERGRVYCPF